MIANELAKTAEVNTSVVRYYARIGLLNPVRNPDNGYREYTKQDIDRIQFIRKAKWLGFTLNDVKTILHEADSGRSPCEEVRKIIINRIVDNQQQLIRLKTIQKRMENAIASWASISNCPPDEDHICGLIDDLEYREEKLDLYVGHKF